MCLGWVSDDAHRPVWGCSAQELDELSAEIAVDCYDAVSPSGGLRSHQLVSCTCKQFARIVR